MSKSHSKHWSVNKDDNKVGIVVTTQSDKTTSFNTTNRLIANLKTDNFKENLKISKNPSNVSNNR